jgi:hypothetical protein
MIPLIIIFILPSLIMIGVALWFRSGKGGKHYRDDQRLLEEWQKKQMRK